MGAQVPLVMALDDPGAVPALVGGKGASLARLVRAGFRVPPGFHMTTRAYLDFAGRTGLREAVPAALSAVDPSDAATLDAAAARPGPDDESGRGLMLVAAQCDRWSWQTAPGWPGKVVWAELHG